MLTRTHALTTRNALKARNALMSRIALKRNNALKEKTDIRRGWHGNVCAANACVYKQNGLTIAHVKRNVLSRKTCSQTQRGA